jgi:hypothetical protein
VASARWHLAAPRTLAKRTGFGPHALRMDLPANCSEIESGVFGDAAGTLMTMDLL